MRLKRFLQTARMSGPGLDARFVAALARKGQEILHRLQQEPAQPNAFAAPFLADAIHAVVPVAAQDQGETVRAGALHRQVERQRAVLVEAGGLTRLFRREEGIVLAFRKRRAFEERDLGIERVAVARRGDIAVGAIGQPHHVVRNRRAHPRTRSRQPPMLDVAFRELARRRIDDLFPGDRRVVQHKRQRILQLVTEPERAARLVEGGPRPDPAGKALIGEPDIDHGIEGGIGRLHLQRVPEFLPARPRLGKARVEVGVQMGRGQRLRLLARARVTQHIVKHDRLARRDLDIGCNGGAGVPARFDRP